MIYSNRHKIKAFFPKIISADIQKGIINTKHCCSFEEYDSFELKMNKTEEKVVKA